MSKCMARKATSWGLHVAVHVLDVAPEAPQRLLLSDIRETAAEGSYSGVQSQRSRLQDLVMATRSKAFTGCFGARMDRIGNSSGLGCRPERRSYCSTVS
uniref:Uncharacterized protein n=1 Tax=Oncorhynchus kisutch TaxID=8019 RepID=A0A8C7ML81_ONCKI